MFKFKYFTWHVKGQLLDAFHTTDPKDGRGEWELPEENDPNIWGLREISEREFNEFYEDCRDEKRV